jgi:hypothetical protein
MKETVSFPRYDSSPRKPTVSSRGSYTVTRPYEVFRHWRQHESSAVFSVIYFEAFTESSCIGTAEGLLLKPEDIYGMEEC